MVTWRNKRPHDAYALSVTNAFYWHRECSCQSDKPRRWRQISGKDQEGAWAAAWLQWLWRTHLKPRGFELIGDPGTRTIDIALHPDQLADLKSALTSGPLSEEPAPIPPFQSGSA